ncbi:MAG TPA: S8 family serine peptidase [Anaerolineales bacterium]|nr:S8 family serine peptidase [Anaerolineales bacterium]
MKRLFVISLTLIASMLLSMTAIQPAAANNDKARVFVQFANGRKANVQNALNAAGAEFHYTFDDLNAFAVSLPVQALAGLERNPNVVLIEEDSPRYPVGVIPNSGLDSQNLFFSSGGQVIPYGVDMVQARDVWDADRNGVVDSGAPTGANRKVCIIDSGYYTGHEDLPNSSSQVSGYNGNLAWDQDGDGHGTHVAGTIVAMNNALGVIGVTPGTVQVYVVRVFGNDGIWAYSSTLLHAAQRCRGGSRANNTERNGFATLYNTNGILSIAAAGNAGTNAHHYPASYDTVISVAAIDSNKLVADFSQYTNQVELAAPGVGVLSTVPYIDSTTLTVGGVTYSGSHIEFSARGSASGALVDGGRCTATNGAWSGKVVLCERGDISFYDKVRNVQLSGGAAAAIYNNVPGGFVGTLGDGNSSTIIGISLSQEDGQFLVANRLGQTANVSSSYTAPASGYEFYDGTSMATPHVSAVAALVWSANPSATNVQIRQVLRDTAEDLGAAGRDNYYGYGLVRAKAAVDAIGGGGGGTDPQELHVGNLTGAKSTKGKNWSATVTITALDQNNAAVSGVVVTGSWSGAKTGTASCTTGTNGACSVSTGNMSSGTSVTFTVSNLAKDGYTYNSSANVVSSITIVK